MSAQHEIEPPNNPPCPMCGDPADHKHPDGHCCGDCCAMWGGMVYDPPVYEWIGKLRAHSVAMQAELADANARVKELEQALESIANPAVLDASNCECDHTTEDRCVNMPNFHCPQCIAAKALAKGAA